MASRAEMRPVTPRGVVFNGKFLSGPPKGLTRMASELIGHMDGLLAAQPDYGGVPSWELMCRPDATRRIPLQRISLRPSGVTRGDAWEQLDLPWLARGKLLVNLCNMAPLLSRGGIAVIHDAHVFLMPESHTASYAAWYRFALPRVAAAADRVLTVSEFSRRSLAAWGVAPAERITVVPNGGDHFLSVEADASTLARFGLRPHGYVLALANAQKHKNVRVLMEAFRRPELAGLKLVLVGPDGAAAFAAQGAPPPANAVFAGMTSDPQLRTLYEYAVCLAFPSLLEGSGLPPLEAMSLGCPVAAAPCGALPETCGVAAAYVDPCDAPAWAAAIRRFADDGDFRGRHVDLGRTHAAARLWRDGAARLLEIIAATAAISSPRPAAAPGTILPAPVRP